MDSASVLRFNRRMMASKQRQKRGHAAYKRGLGAETLCCLALHFKLYRIVARRYKTAQGEIDIIAARGRTLAFIEVKARPEAQSAGEAISAAQQTRLVRAAGLFLARHPAYAGHTLRFDAMLVLPRRWPRHLMNAFES